MLVSSSARRWLGSTTLVGLLLACTLPAVATPQITTTTINPSKPLLLASEATSIPEGTYTQVVRKQMQWFSSPVNSDVSVDSASTPEESVTTPTKPVVVVDKTTQSTKTVSATKQAPPVILKTKPVQVAAAPKQQVSRSSNPTLVDNARSLIGIPYVFGGTSRNGFDCSGYTQYVFEGSDISLPRTSSEQFNVGSSVMKDQLQTGDLVFFTTYASGPSHVGIYIGGGTFVHASNSGVRTTSLSDSYYASRYVGARRVN